MGVTLNWVATVTGLFIERSSSSGNKVFKTDKELLFIAIIKSENNVSFDLSKNPVTSYTTYLYNILIFKFLILLFIIIF